MLGAGKYKVTIGATLLLFVWILLTDVLGRWTTTVSMVMEMQEHEVLTSENLEMKKRELMEAKKSLLSSSPGTGMQIASCATDVFEFIASCASQANIVLELMEPTGVDGEGPVQELAFRVRCETDFHTAGRFISAVENDGFTVRVDYLQMTKRSGGNTLDVTIEAVAYVLNDGVGG